MEGKDGRNKNMKGNGETLLIEDTPEPPKVDKKVTTCEDSKAPSMQAESSPASSVESSHSFVLSPLQKPLRPDTAAEIEAFERVSRKRQERLMAFSRDIKKTLEFIYNRQSEERENHLILEVKQLREEKDQLYSKLLSERERCSVLVQVQGERIKERDEEIASLRKRIEELEVGR